MDKTISLTSDMISSLPDLPRDVEGPVFKEPWQAQVFSIACLLEEQKHFTWAEWAETLGSVIAEKSADTEYYLCWLSALEEMIIKKELLSDFLLQQRKEAWDKAARATPHGEPIELGNGK